MFNQFFPFLLLRSKEKETIFAEWKENDWKLLKRKINQHKFFVLSLPVYCLVRDEAIKKTQTLQI